MNLGYIPLPFSRVQMYNLWELTNILDVLPLSPSAQLHPQISHKPPHHVLTIVHFTIISSSCTSLPSIHFSGNHRPWWPPPYGPFSYSPRWFWHLWLPELPSTLPYLLVLTDLDFKFLSIFPERGCACLKTPWSLGPTWIFSCQPCLLLWLWVLPLACFVTFSSLLGRPALVFLLGWFRLTSWNFGSCKSSEKNTV